MFQKHIYILFTLFYIAFNGMASDLPDFFKVASCKPPSNVRVITTGTDFATIIWKSEASGVAWKLKWRKNGEDYSETNTSDLVNENEYQINNLNSGTKYFFKLKTLCSDDSESNWTPSEYYFTTHLENPSNCKIHLELEDAHYNNDKTYSGETSFFIRNEEFPDGKLGINVFIQNIKLIIDHSWTNDLTIELWSPNDKHITLSSSHKAKEENNGYGNTNIENCSEPIIFSDEACQKLTRETVSFTGNFRPDEPLYALYDSLSPVGKWELKIIDKSTSNSGFLEYVEIDFEPLLCPIPQNISIIPQNDNAVLVNWEQNNNIDSIFFKLNTNGIENIVKSKNNGFFILSGLNSNDSILLSLQSKCKNSVSAFSCTDSVIFLCGTAQLREGFDSFEDCTSACEDCIKKGIWHNAGKQNWLINSGETTTKNTGPQGDVYGNGKYIYFESSSSECNSQDGAILQSECIYIEPAFDGCSMEFSYHMYGVDIGSLSFEVSIDNGYTWKRLFYKEGQASNIWLKQEIPLDEYEKKTCNFRFVAKSIDGGSYGDIAIDDIIFYNSIIADEDSYLYYPDRDGDGYGKDTTAIFFCNLNNDYYVSNNEDCDDTNPDIHPGADEIFCNFIDENCNGMEDDTQTDSPFSIAVDTIIMESCNGSKDGKIAIKIIGGIPPFNFKWSNGSTDSTLTNLSAGKYQCTIEDQTGCGFVTDTFNLNFKEIFDFNISGKALPSCNGKKDGSLYINITGGISPYKYTWNTGDTTSNLQNLKAGLYNVTIIDSTGCIYNSPKIELKATTTFDIGVIEKVNPSCFGSKNGKINLLVQGNASPYSFAWNNTNTDSNVISDLEAGEYYCTITDSQLCFQEYGPIILKQPDSLEIIVSSIDHVTCPGEDNGLIEIDTRGGISPYTFEWKKNNKVISRLDDIYNIEAGKYTILISDNNGCKQQLENIEIKTIDSLNIKLDSLKNVNCANTNDGFIKVIADGGYGDYYYYWSDGTKSSNTIDSINSGLYGVTVEDDLACKQVLDNLEISNLNIPLDLSLETINNIKCYGDTTGNIAVNVISDASPFDYNWSAGTKIIRKENSDTIRNLGIGTYMVTVTDNSGCVGESNSVILSQPEKLELTGISTKNVPCFGENTGEISLNLAGGIKPYSVHWDNDMNGLYLTKLTAGQYSAIISDSNKCEINTGLIEINQPDEIKVTIESYPAHKNQSDGAAIILPTGGVTPYTYLWDENANFQTGNKAINLKSGTYTVTLTDYNDCIKVINVFIAEITDVVENYTRNDIKIYPNPAKNGIFIDHINGLKYQKFNIELQDIAGKSTTLDYKIIDDKKIWISFNSIKNGIFFIHLFNNNNQYFKRIVIMH